MDYAQKKSRNNALQLLRSAAERDVARDFPKVHWRWRRHRETCRHDLKRFLECYFPAAFPLPWSADHLRVIEAMRRSILAGGLFATAMPRGSGKTSLAERAALWALLYGHRRFPVLIGATEAAAATTLEHLKAELLDNDRLARDFPAVCHPVRRLEGNARRAAGQLFRGERTAIVWSASRVTFPTVPPDVADAADVSGSTVAVAGVTGALRGLSHTLASGEVIRPDLAVIDDVQTRESAASPTQTADRLGIIRGDVLGLAGPGRKITAFALVTVIEQDDLADQLLDRERFPQWQGERTAAVYAWPDDEALWQEYHRVRREGLRRGDGGAAATEFYRANRAALDRGARVAWPERFNPDEASAVQHNENLRHDMGEIAYAAEYQNRPLRPEAEADAALTPAEVAARVSGVPRGVVPARASVVTAFVDVQQDLLVWVAAAWSTDFTGHVLDYGTFPPQRARLWTLRKAAPTLGDAFPGSGREGAVYAGLDALTADLLARDWRREDGVLLRADRCLVDCGYLPDTVYDFCGRSPFANVLTPSRGEGIGATRRPMAEYETRQGEKHGWYWLVSATAHRQQRYARFDSNHWKSFAHDRLRMAPGDAGSLSLFGRDPEEHQLFAAHVCAEAPVMVTANGRTVAEWRPRPGAGDNHWLDGLVGVAVAASMAGAAPPGKDPAPYRPKGERRKVSFSEMRARARAGGGR